MRLSGSMSSSIALCVSVSEGTHLLKDGKVLRVCGNCQLRDVLGEVGYGDRAGHVISVRTSTTVTSSKQDAELDDEVQLHAEFGRRYVYFRLGRQLETEATSMASSSERSAFSVLMSSSSEKVLPEAPRTGKNKTQTAIDRLMMDLIEYLRCEGLGFPPSVCDSEGVYVIRSLARALWCIDGCHETLASAAKHKAVPPLPEIWKTFSGYFDSSSRKKKKRQLDSRVLRENSGLLFGMLTKTLLQSKEWTQFRDKIEGLATTMSKYSDVLTKEASEQHTRHSMSTVVRPLGEFAGLQYRPAAPSIYLLSEDETKMEARLVEVGEYQPILFDELDLLGKEFSPMQRYRFLKSFQLHHPVELYTYNMGGTAGNLVFFWSVRTGTSISEQRTESLRVVESLKPRIPQYHTRAMKREFASKCSNITSISPHVRRFMYAQLTGDSSADCNPELEQRMRLVVLGELPELAVDLRHVNSGRPEKYDVFLTALQEVVQDATAEDERRRGVAHMAHFISQRDLHRMASEKCPPDTPIPSLDWVALQFQPKSMQCHRALNYTGRLNVRYSLQARQLRSTHEDDHYCLALFRMQREMATELRDHSTFVCLDDKAKIPVGEPNSPMSTGVHQRPSIVAGSIRPLALDHDQASRGSLTPSVVLHCDIPTSGPASFYKGQLHVLVKDSVLEASNPFRHAVELCQTLRDSKYVSPILFAYTDGGADHRTTFRSVQLAWILVFMELDVDMVVAARTAPGHSYINPAERCMSTLNLALQNCALSRVLATDEQLEKRIKSCNTMEALRKQQPLVQGAWTASIQEARQIFERRFNRLIYSERQVHVHDPATQCALKDLARKASQIDPEIDGSILDPKQKDLINKRKLNDFISTHCQERHYSFQVKKCGLDSCEFGVCQPPRLPREVFDSLCWLPDPIPDTASTGHYKRYADLKGVATTDKHRPSLKSKADHDASILQKQGCPNSLLTAQRVHDVIICSECSKPRCIFSNNKLSAQEQCLLDQVKENNDYSCGSPLVPPEHDLHGKVFVRILQRCSDHIELAYYSCKQAYDGVCCYCTSSDASKPHKFLQEFHTVLPICENCRLTKAVITRMPKAGSKRKKADKRH